MTNISIDAGIAIKVRARPSENLKITWVTRIMRRARHNDTMRKMMKFTFVTTTVSANCSIGVAWSQVKGAVMT